MKIYVVGSSKNKFLPLDKIREKFLIDKPHDGDNIDSLNPWYCELTGLYYMWKHCNDDIVGLEHYRRYFVNAKNNLLSEPEIRKLLGTQDILCNKSDTYSKSTPVITWINQHGKRADFDKFVLFSKHYVGQEYANSCWRVLNSDYHCLCNMFICRKELMDEYCTFIFDLLFSYQEAEKYFNRQLPKRIMGYFSEFLFRAWLELHHKKIYFTKRRLVI